MITLWGRNNSTNVKKVLWTLEEPGFTVQPNHGWHGVRGE